MPNYGRYSILEMRKDTADGTGYWRRGRERYSRTRTNKWDRMIYIDGTDLYRWDSTEGAGYYR